MIICKKARKAFSLHKQSAKGRHIKFLFSLEGWCLWWAQHLGPNWLELRGTTSEQYVMGRIGDKGPYASWNVECVTTNQNQKDKVKYKSAARGTQHGSAKLKVNTVKAIYLAEGSISEIAERYKCSRHQVNDIKSGRNWRHLTIFLGEAGNTPKNHILTNDEIKNIYLASGTFHKIAKEFNSNFSTVRSIRKGLRHKHITEKLPKPILFRRGGQFVHPSS